jgi:CDP-glucose 4,6-dehydratase
VAWIAEKMTGFWGDGAKWVLDPEPGVHEAGYLKLDASRARADLGWTPRLRLETALEWVVQWTRAWRSGADMHAFTLAQIEAYEALLHSDEP